MLNVWTLGPGDQGITIAPFPGGALNTQISRTSGVFSMFVGGVDLSSMLGTNQLNANNDLTERIFAANAFNDTPKTGTLSEFRVGVDAAQVPEPGSLALLLTAFAFVLVHHAHRPLSLS